MNTARLSRLVAAFRYTRHALFATLLIFSLWQMVVLMHEPRNEAPSHLVIALVALGVGARLYVAKSSTLNRALDAIAALHTKERS